MFEADLGLMLAKPYSKCAIESQISLVEPVNRFAAKTMHWTELGKWNTHELWPNRLEPQSQCYRLHLA